MLKPLFVMPEPLKVMADDDFGESVFGQEKSLLSLSASSPALAEQESIRKDIQMVVLFLQRIVILLQFTNSHSSDTI